MIVLDNKNLISKNVIYSVFTRVLILIIGLIVPRLLLVYFGSEINGLLSTVTQIFTYLALLEAGIGNSTMNALYKPLDEKKFDIVNEILVEAKGYYRKVSFFYALGIIIFSTIYPFLVTSTLSKWTISLIIILQGATNFIGYFFTSYYIQLLTASGYRYISENINFIIYVLTSIIKILLIVLGFNIVYVQLGFFLASLIKIPLINNYTKKKFNWLNLKGKSSKRRLKERGAFIVHEISGTIFNNTDVFIISTFCSFSLASVYAVYNLVFGSLLTILTTAISGLSYILGQSQYKGIEKLRKIYDMYNILYLFASFVIFTTGCVFVRPFVMLYTKNVNDINYFIPFLSLLFTLINLMSSSRAVGSLLINVSGNAEKTKYRSMAEAIINLLVSIVLVQIIGIYGVLVGTIIALIYRMNDIIIYSNKHILKRSLRDEYKYHIGNFTTFAVIYVASNFINIQVYSIFDFLIKAVIGGLIVAFIFAIENIIINKEVIKMFYQSILKIKKKEKNKNEFI